MIYMYDVIVHRGCPHQPWARPTRAVNCPDGCPYRDREHHHVEYSNGYGEIIGADGELIEPWDLHRPTAITLPAPHRRSRPGVRRYNQHTKQWEAA
jgi:hypothetical protein